MATGNIFLGTARGKFGDVVLRRRNGKQVVSTKVTPANPKSEAQCKQRMVFATSTTSASRLRKIINHSFEGVKVGQTSVNYFTKLNTPMLRAGRNYDGSTEVEHNYYMIKGSKGLAWMPFIVSKGSLSFPAYTLSSALAEGELGFTGAELQGVSHDALIAPYIASEAEYANFLSVLGLAPGDQLSLVAGITDDTVDAEYSPEGAVNYFTTVEFARIIFKPASDVDFSTPFALCVDGQFNPNIVNFERSSNWVEKIVVEKAASGNAVIAPVTQQHLVMVALIRSAYDGSKWLRSTARFACTTESDALAWQVWPSYAAQEGEGTSNLFLNRPYRRSNDAQNDESYAPGIVDFEITSPTDSTISVDNFQFKGLVDAPYTVEVAAPDGSVIGTATGESDPITVTTSTALVVDTTYQVKVTASGASLTKPFTKN